MLPVVGGAAVSDPLHERAIRRSADRKSTRLNSSHLVISYAVFFFKKSTRLNSSHLVISYAVFCLKKKIQLGRVLYAVIESDISLVDEPYFLSHIINRATARSVRSP